MGERGHDRVVAGLTGVVALLLALGVVGAVAGWWPSAEERAAAAVCDRWSWDATLSAPDNERRLAAVVQQYGASYVDTYALAAAGCPRHLRDFPRAVSRLDTGYETEGPTAAALGRCLRTQDWVEHTFATEPGELERWRALVAACYARAS